MVRIKKFELFEASLNEATSKSVALADERETQAKYKDQLENMKKLLAKADVSNKKQYDKDMDKSKIVQNMAKFTVMLGQSMAKEALLMQQAAKENQTNPT